MCDSIITITASVNDAESRSEALNGYLHDRWFDIDRIDFDPNTKNLRLPIIPRKDGSDELLLEIAGATDLNVIDTEQIGTYDIHSLVLDAAGSRLVVLGNIPVELAVSLGPNWMITLRDDRCCGPAE